MSRGKTVGSSQVDAGGSGQASRPRSPRLNSANRAIDAAHAAAPPRKQPMGPRPAADVASASAPARELETASTQPTGQEAAAGASVCSIGACSQS